VPLDLVGELVQLLFGRQLSVDQQVADLDEVRLLRELFDRVSAVAQDAGVTVDVSDGALRRGRVDEAFVEGRVSGLGEQRTQRDAIGALRGRNDVEVKLATGVGQGGLLVPILRVICHGDPFVAAGSFYSESYKSVLQKVVPFPRSRPRGSTC
jgi:hypothetical protein